MARTPLLAEGLVEEQAGSQALAAVKSRMERKRKTEKDPAGTANPEAAAPPGRRWRSMRVACSTEKVVIWE